MRGLIAVFLMLAGSVAADDWVPLVDDLAIAAALADRTVIYDAYSMQHFGIAGDTQFVDDRAADGRWAARDGQYCSVWPPSDVWTCYDFAIRGNQVRFTGEDGSVSEGRFN